ncbi:uncharacterized protein LOC126681914 [Mercurialis annua]|uniref:uncharacterized protein LOC126681914 n=1 Tax=Mercurialis annua TaxID=3986 RepID=UPI00215FB0B7|nr:uncharacterized protein LOC126681914 [Mercurialis annua]
MSWVKVENTESWTWFMELLKSDLHLGNITVFMSDKQKVITLSQQLVLFLADYNVQLMLVKTLGISVDDRFIVKGSIVDHSIMLVHMQGLVNAVKELFPYSEHRFFWRHLWSNYRSTFHHQHLKPLIWNIGIASYKSKYVAAMKVLEDSHAEAYEWISARPRVHWSRYYFGTEVKCDILLNNLAEAFNKYILAARVKPILTMFEMIRTQLMKRISDKQILGSKFQTDVCPKILKKLDKIIDEGWKYTATPTGGPQVQVSGPGGQFVVNLPERTCTCRRWDLTGIPCVHACAAIHENNEHPQRYIDDCYSKAVYERVYSFVINPMNGADMWETDPNPFNIILPPSPVQQKKKGRKATVRRLEAEELEKQAAEKASEAQATRAKLSPKGRQRIKCSECGQFGQNIRKHLKERGQASGGGEQQPSVNEGEGPMAESEVQIPDATTEVPHASPAHQTFPSETEAACNLDSQTSAVDDGAPPKRQRKKSGIDASERYKEHLRKRPRQG